MFRLREIRKLKGLTMKELGALVGVTESAIGLYENGRRKPDYEMLLKLSEALDCSVADILGVNENNSSVDDELVRQVQLLRDREDLRGLLDVCSRRTPEQIQKMIDLFGSMPEG